MNTYGYVGGNPLFWIDPYGLQVLLCKRKPDLIWPLNLADHHWIKTDDNEAGMGAVGGDVPGVGGNSDYPFVSTEMISHKGQSLDPNASCEPVDANVNEQCVNKMIQPGTPTGRWSPFNQCQTAARQVLDSCFEGPKPPADRTGICGGGSCNAF